MDLDPVFGRVEVGRCLPDQAGDQIRLLGLDMADGDVCLATEQVAERVGGDHLDGNARYLLAQPPHQRGQQIGRHHVGGRDRDDTVHGL
jgi:hypothetical protein